MPEYSYAASYTKPGLDGVGSQGAKHRAAAIGELARSLGGKLVPRSACLTPVLGGGAPTGRSMHCPRMTRPAILVNVAC
jgi:hypothetical protein